jgi:hypothetical protein
MMAMLQPFLGKTVEACYKGRENRVAETWIKRGSGEKSVAIVSDEG